jgi:hypothetical protein
VGAPPPLPPDDEHDDPVPIFGSWPAIYTAVIAVALVCIVLSAVFSSWPY